MNPLITDTKIEERNKAVELDKAWETSFDECLSLCSPMSLSVYSKRYASNGLGSLVVPAMAFVL